MDETKVEPQEPSKEYKDVMEQFKVTLRLSRIGEHFLTFIVQCRKLNAPPAAVVEAFRTIKSDPDTKIKNPKELLPVLCFVDWINDPTEERFQDLQKAIGVKIDKIVQDDIKQKEDKSS